MRKKRGMTGEKWFLVSVVLIILAVAIILFFYARAKDAIDIKREVCRNSVLTRSTFNFNAIEAGRKTIPLKCETDKVCFYTEKKKCESLSKDENDKSVRYIEVKNSEEVIKEIVGMLYDCHWMFGEGKANFMPSRSQATDYCLICARFAFEQGIQNAENNKFAMQFKDIYEYMSAHHVNENAKNKVSFMKYVYGYDDWREVLNQLKVVYGEGSEAYNKLKEHEDLKKIPASEIQALPNDLGNNPIELGEEYAIASRFITKANYAGTYATVAAIGAGALIFTGTLLSGGTAVGAVIALVAKAGTLATAGGIAFFATFNDDFYYAPGAILRYQDLKGWNCESIETTS